MRVPAHPIAHSPVSGPSGDAVSPFANGTSNIWAGAVVSDPTGGGAFRGAQFWSAEAEWNIPSVLLGVLPGVPDFIPGYSAVAPWVGLDNGANDLWQSGTDTGSYAYNFGGFSLNFVAAGAWLESLPAASYFLPNIVLSPGDDVYVHVFVGTSSGLTTFSGNGLASQSNTMWFIFYDFTSGQSAFYTYSFSQGASFGARFTGTTAEFIVERPTVGAGTGFPADLGMFGAMVMRNCVLFDSPFAYNGWSDLTVNGAPGVSLGTVTNDAMKSTSTNDLLAESFIYSAGRGTSNILFFWTNWQ
jgi:hypothetical protein